MELSPREAASYAVTQEIPNILWNPKVHCRVHKSPPLIHIMSLINPVYSTPSYLTSILILSTHLSFWLSHQYPICIPFFLICATCPVYLILFDLIKVATGLR
jgi:hypothetical protein